MIVFALIALGWWLAAPDRFTAAARTATGTGLKAAGTGARAHWNGGRDGRKAVRTDRRDRWHKRGGWWRALLGLEYGAVVTGKAAKGAGKLAGAAVKPVPGAVRDGWRKGQDRHRARTAGRPMPVALDPPWWRRPVSTPVPDETAQDNPQDSGATVEDSPGTGRDSSSVHAGGRCAWTVTPDLVATFTGAEVACGRPAKSGPFCGRHAKKAARTPCPQCGAAMGSNLQCAECVELRIAGGDLWPYGPSVEGIPEPVPGQSEGRDQDADSPARTPFFPDAPDGPVLDDEADIRTRNPELALIQPGPLTEGQRRFWHLRDRGYPGALDQDGWPAPDFSTGAIVNPMPYLHQPAATSPAAAGEAPIKVWKSSAECGGCGADANYTTDTTCPNCGAGFTSIQSVYPEYADAIRRERPDLPVTTTVEGDPVFENEANHSQAEKMRRDQARRRSSASPGASGATPTELRTHVAVQDFAKQVDSLSEASDFVVVAEQAREVGAKSRAGGFGAEMDSAVDELEAVAKRFAQDVDSLRAQAHHLAQTSLSVQGS